MLAERRGVDVGVEGDRDAESRRRISGATSVCAQPGFGVVVMWPQVGEARLRSTGPNEPIPIASTGPSRSKKATARSIVSSGVVVGNRRRSRAGRPGRCRSRTPTSSRPPRCRRTRSCGVRRDLRRRTTRARRTRPGGRRRRRRSGPRPCDAARAGAASRASRTSPPAAPSRSGTDRAARRTRCRRSRRARRRRGTSRPALAHRFDRAERDEVVDREHRGRRIARARAAGASRRAAGRVDASRRRRAPGRAGCRPRPARPRSPRRRSRAVETSSDLDDDADAAMAERDQMLDELTRAAEAVAEDDVATRCRRRAVDQHERHTELREPRAGASSSGR